MVRPQLPTPAQEAKCFQLCHNLTAMYISVHLVRIDERNGTVLILAGEEIEIVIDRSGQWGYEQ
jgi:hypothetical protein